MIISSDTAALKGGCAFFALLQDHLLCDKPASEHLPCFASIQGEGGGCFTANSTGRITWSRDFSRKGLDFSSSLSIWQ